MSKDIDTRKKFDLCETEDSFTKLDRAIVKYITAASWYLYTYSNPQYTYTEVVRNRNDILNTEHDMLLIATESTK